MISLILHTTPIRQIGENPAFDLAHPRHSADISLAPLRSTINGENDNMTVSFRAGPQLQAAMMYANNARLQVFDGATLEFDGTVSAVRFDGLAVILNGVA